MSPFSFRNLVRRALRRQRPAISSRPARFRPRLEVFEERTLLSVLNWIGGSGDWAIPGNWRDAFDLTNHVPNPADDAVISVAGIEVTHATGTHTVNSLSASNGTFTLSGGTLGVTTRVQGTSTFRLAGGTLANAAVESGTILTGTTSGGVLQGVSLRGNLDLTTAGGVTARVTSGLTLSGGSILVGNAAGTTYASLIFAGSQTLGGTGTVQFGGGPIDNNQIAVGGAGDSLTIGANVTIQGKNGDITANVRNQGTIKADTAGGTIRVRGTNWTNSGSLQALNGSTLTLLGPWSSSGPITVSGNSTANLGDQFSSDSWSNTGTITATNSRVRLGGIFTVASLGTLNRTGGEVWLWGTLNNTGSTLTLNSATGPWSLEPTGIINGGTVATATGTELLFRCTIFNCGTLRGVTINGDLRGDGLVAFEVSGGLTLNNSTIAMGTADGRVAGNILFTDASTLGGTGTLLFGGNARSNSLSFPSVGQAIIGPNITVQGKNARISGNFINNGTIQADVAGGTFQLSGNFTNAGSLQALNTATVIVYGYPFTNQGPVTVTGGSTLSLNVTWSNSNTITITGSTANLGDQQSILGGAWSNTGTIAATNATVNLGGTFTTAGLGAFNRSGGTVNLTGTLNNTGTLTLNSTTGPWNLKGGTINGGRVVESGAALGFTNGGGTLNGVNFTGDLDLMTVDSARATVTGGLTLNNSTIFLGNAGGSTSGNLFFVGLQTLGGTGTVQFGGDSIRNGLVMLGSVGPLTIGAGITIQGAGFVDAGAQGFVNRGTIKANTAGGTLTLRGIRWTNSGMIQASNGATLDLQNSWSNSGTITVSAATGNIGSTFGAETWSNTNTITATNATINLGGSFTPAGLGTFNSSAGTVNLRGIVDNTAPGSTLTLNGTTGSWNLSGGTINGGTVTESGGAQLLFTGIGGTLNGVTFNGDLDLATINYARATVRNRLTLNGGTVSLGNAAGSTYGFLSFMGPQTLGGTGTVVFGGSTNNYLESGDPLTIGSGTTIRGKNGSVNAYGQAFVNEGTIQADTVGGTIRVRGSNWTNSGSLKAQNGGTLSLTGPWSSSGMITVSGGSTANLGDQFSSDPWSNTGTITATNGTVSLGGTFTTAGLGTVNGSGSTFNLTGTLNNTSSTLTLNNALGTWSLGGTINGGTVAGAPLRGIGGTLNGVTFNSDLDLTTINGGGATVRNGLTLNGATVSLGNAAGSTYGGLDFMGPQTLGGTGTVVFGGSPNNSLSLQNGGPLTLGPGITIRGKYGSIDAAFINQGTIQADTAGGTLWLQGTNWTNTGTIQALNGATLWSTGTTSNFAAGTLTGGTWAVFSASTLWLSGADITTNAATILLDGVNANFWSAFNFNGLANLAGTSAGGRFTIQNGRNFSTRGDFTNAGTLTVGPSSTFAVTGSFTNFSSGTLTGGTYQLFGTFQFTNAAIATNAATIVLDGPAARIIDQSSADALANLATIAATGSLTIQNGRNLTTGGDLSNHNAVTVGAGSTLTVTGNYSQASRLTILAGGMVNLNGGGSASGTVSNAGTLLIGSGTTFAVSGTYSQAGTLNVAATATMNMTGSFTNFSAGTLTGGTYLIAGMFQFTGADIVTNAAIIVLDGAGAAQVLNDVGGNGLANFAANAAGASFSLLNGRNFTTAADFSNLGTLLIGPGSTFTVAGDYTQGPAGVLVIQLGGTPDTGLFGQLNVRGIALLDGTLALTLVGDYVPSTGDAFPILVFASRGDLPTDFATLPAGFDLNYDDVNGSLTVVAQ